MSKLYKKIWNTTHDRGNLYKNETKIKKQLNPCSKNLTDTNMVKFFLKFLKDGC